MEGFIRLKYFYLLVFRTIKIIIEYVMAENDQIHDEVVDQVGVLNDVLITGHHLESFYRSNCL